MANLERVGKLHEHINELVRDRVSGTLTIYFSDGGVMKAMVSREIL